MSTTVVKAKMFPTITTVTYAIADLRKQAKEAELRKIQLTAERNQLLLKPLTAENEADLNKLDTLIQTFVAKRQRLSDRISELEKSLPIVTQAAKKNEKALSNARELVEEIRNQIDEIDSELIQALKQPLELLHKRQETIQRLSQTSSVIRSLTAALSWHPASAEPTPVRPTIMEELRKYL